jgi:hypothetical protein
MMSLPTFDLESQYVILYEFNILFLVGFILPQQCVPCCNLCYSGWFMETRRIGVSLSVREFHT